MKDHRQGLGGSDSEACEMIDPIQEFPYRGIENRRDEELELIKLTMKSFHKIHKGYSA